MVDSTWFSSLALCAISTVASESTVPHRLFHGRSYDLIPRHQCQRLFPRRKYPYCWISLWTKVGYLCSGRCLVLGIGRLFFFFFLPFFWFFCFPTRLYSPLIFFFCTLSILWNGWDLFGIMRIDNPMWVVFSSRVSLWLRLPFYKMIFLTFCCKWL